VWDTGIGTAPARRYATFSEDHQINNPARDRSKGHVHAPVRRRTGVLEDLLRLFLERGRARADCRIDGWIETVLADESRIPDLIATDIHLRDGATGMEVVERTRLHFPWAGNTGYSSFSYNFSAFSV
jgi:hypothetical protein